MLHTVTALSLIAAFMPGAQIATAAAGLPAVARLGLGGSGSSLPQYLLQCNN